MGTSGRLVAVVVALAACGADGPPEVSTNTDTGSSSASGSEAGAGTETETETETETGAQPSVSVKWIEVAASDYKLELDPKFDAGVIEYTALADGPGISVYVDVIVDADIDAVLVNGDPAVLHGFRTWRSSEQTELISPTSVLIEVAEVVYAIEVVVP